MCRKKRVIEQRFWTDSLYLSCRVNSHILQTHDSHVISTNTSDIRVLAYLRRVTMTRRSHRTLLKR